MKKIINFRIFRGERYYVAECLDLPIVTQGLTLDETVENIREALNLHIEGEDLEAYDILPNPAISVNIDLGEFEYA
ncbi:MAG: type II toxin-antitoxin system HicB family antitoxin [Candidatus Kapabacteria bacterium]|nr:type II toxin-antitoxin system HicB family antitoxin [Candidatus Kapabacteria bacterium]